MPLQVTFAFWSTVKREKTCRVFRKHTRARICWCGMPHFLGHDFWAMWHLHATCSSASALLAARDHGLWLLAMLSSYDSCYSYMQSHTHACNHTHTYVCSCNTPSDGSSKLSPFERSLIVYYRFIPPTALLIPFMGGWVYFKGSLAICSILFFE